MVEQLDSEVPVDNGVQPKSRLDKVAVQDEAEGLKTPEEQLQTPDRGRERCSMYIDVGNHSWKEGAC